MLTLMCTHTVMFNSSAATYNAYTYTRTYTHAYLQSYATHAQVQQQHTMYTPTHVHTYTSTHVHEYTLMPTYRPTQST